jgi:hypothetical protein
MMRIILMIAFALALASPAPGRDDGRYGQSPLKPWFDGLKSRDGVSCCSNADGLRLEDPEWEQTPAGFRVKLDGEWWEVPDGALITVPNRVGYAMVWPAFDGGKLIIRCFRPGSAI